MVLLLVSFEDSHVAIVRWWFRWHHLKAKGSVSWNIQMASHLHNWHPRHLYLALVSTLSTAWTQFLPFQQDSWTTYMVARVLQACSQRVNFLVTGSEATQHHFYCVLSVKSGTKAFQFPGKESSFLLLCGKSDKEEQLLISRACDS